MTFMGWKGHLRSCSSNPLLQAGIPPSRPGCSQPHPAWPCVLPGRGHSQPHWQHVAASHHSHSKEFLPNIYSKSTLFQFRTISACSVSRYPRDTHLATRMSLKGRHFLTTLSVTVNVVLKCRQNDLPLCVKFPSLNSKLVLSLSTLYTGIHI